MNSLKINCGNINISNDNRICIIAGPCQLETEQHALDMAGKIKDITDKFGLGFIYKTSFDKPWMIFKLNYLWKCTIRR